MKRLILLLALLFVTVQANAQEDAKVFMGSMF